MALSLFVTDIDNTLFDWVGYYVRAFSGMLEAVEEILRIPYAQLAEEAKEVFIRHGSIEYPFVVQELPSVAGVFGDDIDGMLARVVKPARQRFNALAEPLLRTYEGVPAALAAFRLQHP